MTIDRDQETAFCLFFYKKIIVRLFAGLFTQKSYQFDH